MTKPTYKPRHGFDIRAKPPGAKKGAPKWAAANTRDCDHEGCKEKAAVRSAKSPREPTNYVWLCQEHAREHNKNWNFFDGLSEEEAKKERLSKIYGDRPTWSMGKNDRAARNQKTVGAAEMADAFGLFREAARKGGAAASEGRRFTKMQAKAFETLGLPTHAEGDKIRKRYAELARRFHPDSNEGDRGAEDQLTEVVKAYKVLKRAKIC